MRYTNISQAKATLSKLVAEVEAGGEVVLSRAGKPVAKLIKYEPRNEPRDLDVGTWRGRVWMSEDFDELPAEFLEHFSPAVRAASDE